MATAYNSGDFHDNKVAKITNSVFKWVRKTNKWEAKSEDFIEDFIVLTECFAKVSFDNDRGTPVGMDEEGNQIRAGEFVISRKAPYDIKRDPDADSLDDSRYLIEDVVMTVASLVELATELEFEDTNRILKQYASVKSTVFDSSTGRYKEVTGKVQLRIIYYRPTILLPKGQIVYFTEDFIIGTKELPLGIFPWVYIGFDRLTSSPRHSGIIRVCKPFQIEYNRTNSKMAEHQITLGDDRVFLNGGGKMTGGKLVHGVRQYHITGEPPIIQGGRSGAQYSDYSKDTKADMYEAANIDYITLDKQNSGDSYQMLYASIKDKKKFVKYVRKYERFVTEIFELVSTLSKTYLTPLHIIKVAGEREAINIEEYKSMDDVGYELKVEATATDLESKFGKVLTLSQMLQYVGSSMTPEQIGYIYKQMPYGDGSTVLNTMTMKTESAENLILSLDRGEQIPTMKYDDHEFSVNALYTRMKQPDFPMQGPEVAQLYQQKIQELETFIAQKQQEVQQANMGIIPASGYLTTVNTSWTNPDTGKVERIKLPTESIYWLTEQLRKQGAFSASLGENGETISADMANMMPQAQQGPMQGQNFAPQVQGDL